MSGDDDRPIPPATALDRYVEHRRDEVSEQTLQSHRYRIEQFIEWCEEIRGIEYMADFDGVDLHEFRAFPREQDDLKAVTHLGQLSTLRQFLRVCAILDACDEKLAINLLLPTVRIGEEASDQMLKAHRAVNVPEHLSDNHYASRQHDTPFPRWRSLRAEIKLTRSRSTARPH